MMIFSFAISTMVSTPRSFRFLNVLSSRFTPSVDSFSLVEDRLPILSSCSNFVLSFSFSLEPLTYLHSSAFGYWWSLPLTHSSFPLVSAYAFTWLGMESLRYCRFDSICSILEAWVAAMDQNALILVVMILATGCCESRYCPQRQRREYISDGQSVFWCGSAHCRTQPV